MSFDTLKLAQALRERAQFTPEMAEGAAGAIAEAIQSDLATKPDVGAVQTDLAAIEAKLRADLAATEAKLTVAIADSKTEILKWIFGMIGFQTIVILGAVIALSGVVRH